MAVQTGGRVRHRGGAEAHSSHPAQSSLVLQTTTAQVSSFRVPEQASLTLPRDGSPTDDGLSAPALALLAAAAIFEGYRWLRLIPGRPSVPDAFAVAAIAAAITLGLVRPAGWTRSGPVRRVARAGACSIVAAALLVPITGVEVIDRIVGTVSLLLAVAALVGVASREQHRRSDRPSGVAPPH